MIACVTRSVSRDLFGKPVRKSCPALYELSSVFVWALMVATTRCSFASRNSAALSALNVA
jgi:hypothetical protein